MADLDLRCACGAVRAVLRDVTSAGTNRLVCHCRGCRAYAQHLGRADTLLDARGGTDVVQLSPAQLEFTAGFDRLACLRMTPTGVVRWYARCCDSPIANTLDRPGMPFVGLFTAALDTPDPDAVVGPVRARVNRRFPRDEARRIGAGGGALFRMLAHFAVLTARWRWRGDHRRSPFFDPQTGALVQSPTLIDAPLPDAW